MAALNNLGVVAKDRNDYALARDYIQQALVLAREIGMQLGEAAFSINLGDVDIRLGKLSVAGTELREGLALALRLGALPWVLWAVAYFANLAYAEGQRTRALELIGLARLQAAWGSDHQHDLDVELSHWGLDSSMVEAGMAKGAALDWEKTINELLMG
jgi:tetratricopeptide (TPR) repeat protein